MPTSSTTIASPPGESSSTGGEEEPMSATSTSSIGSSFRFVPAFCLGVVAAVVFQLAWGGLTLTSFFLKLFIYVSFALLCFLAGSFVLLVRKSPIKVSCFDRNRRQSAVQLEFFHKLMARFLVPVQESSQSRRVVVSHNVDKALKEVFDYAYRDYILSWYIPLSRDEGQLYSMLSDDWRQMIGQLRSRLADIDLVDVVCYDTVRILHTHFTDLKAASVRPEESGRPFPLHPCLVCPDSEMAFLRCVARILLLCLLPQKDAKSHTLRCCLTEVITTKVLKPLVEVLSDPDSINRMLLSQLEQREQQAEQQKKAYTYAASYEDFIKLISTSADVNFLKQLRYQIVVEIIHATTIGSLPQLKKQKERKGKESAAMKADLLRARDMKRYINQLTVAKKQCEKRIRLLGGPNYENNEEGGADDSDEPQSQKILRFDDILCNPGYREHFRVYMERVDKRALISFWELVEALKTANKNEVPQIVGEIYQKFFVESREIPVEKFLLKEIQQSLVGNRGTQVFVRLQEQVAETMRERYYPSFLVSDLYDRLIRRDELHSQSQCSTEEKEEECRGLDVGEEVCDEGSKGINEQASYAATKLHQLYDKLEYKRQALGSIQNAPKPDKKIVSKLKEEIGAMEREHSELQQHITRTDWWCENLGHWRATITAAEATEEGGETVACYSVCVTLVEGEEAANSRWSVQRKLTEFQMLHRKLTECFPSLKKLQLPSLSKLPFKSIDQKFLDKSKTQLNAFLQVMAIQKKSSFSLASFLERLPGDFFSHTEEDTDDDSDLSDYGDEADGKRDALAEPCFMLIGEIFELRGMFNLEIDDELESFIKERKARVAEDKASFEQDPPYMEIKTKQNKAYGSTVKENIPPKSLAQEKEENCSMGLPLGVEYERKKQRLQRELRMDYRRYMAQKKQFVEPGPLIHLDNRRSVKAGVLPKHQPSSRRDAATLTEDNRGLHKALCLTEFKTLCPEENEGLSSVGLRHPERLGRPVDLESEEDDYCKAELELMEDREHRKTEIDVNYEKRRSNKTVNREKRENPVGVRDGMRSTSLTKNEDAEFATGLMIGGADTEDTLQKKERYRQELQEQIAEQHRNKKREKDLDLKVAATGANDPEKQPDRIRQFGLCWRKDQQVLKPSTSGQRETPSRGPAHNEKIDIGDREMPPPEQPHMAFQSPLLEYSSALGGGGLFPSSHPAAPAFPRAMDTPRYPLFPQHATLSEAYRSQYGQPHHDCGPRNLLDPNMAYYGHMPVPGSGPPISYWNIPVGGAVSSQFGTHSPQSQHSGSIFPEHPMQPRSEAADNSQVRAFPSEGSKSARERIFSYREALKQQIQEQQERRLLEREEAKRYEAQLEADRKNHQPWGRGGGGAPLRDSTGNLIADLNQMHKLNEEAYSNPEQWQRRATAAMMALGEELPDPVERVSGFTHVQTPQFARGNVFANQPTPRQVQEQDKYKAYLKQQIDEKMCKKAEERERRKLEEEKEEKKLAEQRARIQREYEEEQEKKKHKEMEQKAKNEELIHLAEQKKKEAERKKKEAEEKENAVLRRQYERERQPRVEEVYREPSPPIPTLQKKHGPQKYSPRPPTVNSQHSTAPLSERSLSGLQSPPVPACRNQLRAAGDQHNVFNELSALRRQLRSEQKRLEVRLQQDDWEEMDSALSDRHQERPVVDVFDMARLRLQAPVRRPNSRKVEPRNLLRIHDSLQLKNTDRESRLSFREVHQSEEVGVASSRRQDYKDPSQQSTAQHDYFDLSPPQQRDYLRSLMGGSARGSLLESESAFVDPLGDAFPMPHTPEFEKPPLLSARDRRRLARQSLHPQDRAASSQPFHQHDDYTDDRLQEEAQPSGSRRRRGRARHLTELSRRGNTAGPVNLSDDDSSPARFSLHDLNNQSSVETVATDLWMRPGTSDILKCLDRPSRRGRLAM